MDDGMLGGAMTLEGIGKQLTDIQRGLSDVQAVVGGLRTEVAGIRTDIAEIKTDVAVLARNLADLSNDVGGLKTDLAALDHKTTVQFEETRGLLRFGLEAREALRETVEHRFREADHKHDEQIALLHAVVRHVGGEARP